MLLKSDFICFNSLVWQEHDLQWDDLLCSCVITINPALISCSGLRTEVPFFLWPVHVGPCTKQVDFVSHLLSADGHKFCSNLPQIVGSFVIRYYVKCLECCKHNQIYALPITDFTHNFHIFGSLT